MKKLTERQQLLVRLQVLELEIVGLEGRCETLRLEGEAARKNLAEHRRLGGARCVCGASFFGPSNLSGLVSQRFILAEFLRHVAVEHMGKVD